MAEGPDKLMKNLKKITDRQFRKFSRHCGELIIDILEFPIKVVLLPVTLAYDIAGSAPRGFGVPEFISKLSYSAFFLVATVGTFDIAMGLGRKLVCQSHEVVGQRCTELLVCEEYTELARNVVKRLSSGQSWSGQFPFKKRSAHMFMAMVTKSLWYEDGDLFGIITVTSDVALLNQINSENMRTSQANGQPGTRGINLKSIQWHPQAQIASTVSNLASKVFPTKCGEDACNASANARDVKEEGLDTIGGKSQEPPRVPATRLNFSLLGRKGKANAESSETDGPMFDIAQPSKLVAKVISKLHITGFGALGEEKCENIQQNGHDKNSSNEDVMEPYLPSASDGKYSHILDVTRRTFVFENRQITSTDAVEGPIATCLPEQLPKSSFQVNDIYLKPQIEKQQSPKSGEITRSRNVSSSNKSENESSLMINCEIFLEDICLREEIGRGAYGIVYHGIWRGSALSLW